MDSITVIVIYESSNNFWVVDPWKAKNIVIWGGIGKLEIKFITG